MILAEKITEARKKNGWSQEEMAEKLSVSRQAVSKWESAQSTPDLQKVLRLAEIFGVSTDYLLKDELKSETGTEILEYAAEESSVRKNQTRSWNGDGKQGRHSPELLRSVSSARRC